MTEAQEPTAMVLMPREPTAAMLAAFQKGFTAGLHLRHQRRFSPKLATTETAEQAGLRAMIAALASPPAQGTDGLREAAKIAHETHLHYADVRDHLPADSSSGRDWASGACAGAAEVWRLILSRLPVESTAPAPPVALNQPEPTTTGPVA